MKKVIITGVLVGALITPSVMGSVSADNINSSSATSQAIVKSSLLPSKSVSIITPVHKEWKLNFSVNGVRKFTWYGSAPVTPDNYANMTLGSAYISLTNYQETGDYAPKTFTFTLPKGLFFQKQYAPQPVTYNLYGKEMDGKACPIGGDIKIGTVDIYCGSNKVVVHMDKYYPHDKRAHAIAINFDSDINVIGEKHIDDPIDTSSGNASNSCSKSSSSSSSSMKSSSVKSSSSSSSVKSSIKSSSKKLSSSSKVIANTVASQHYASSKKPDSSRLTTSTSPSRGYASKKSVSSSQSSSVVSSSKQLNSSSVKSSSAVKSSSKSSSSSVKSSTAVSSSKSSSSSSVKSSSSSKKSSSGVKSSSVASSKKSSSGVKSSSFNSSSKNGVQSSSAIKGTKQGTDNNTVNDVNNTQSNTVLPETGNKPFNVFEFLIDLFK